MAMTTVEIRQLIERYLDLVKNGTGSIESNEKALIEVLDRLAVLIHDAPQGEVTDVDTDAPRLEEEAIRAKVAELFPAYGFYVGGQLLDPKLDNEIMVMDAIDDITDIALDLHEVVWTWDHIGETDALWFLHFGFIHWGAHLRHLQAYLHEEHSNR